MDNKLIEKYKQELLETYRASANTKAWQRDAKNNNTVNTVPEMQPKITENETRNVAPDISPALSPIRQKSHEFEDTGFSSPEEMRRFMGEDIAETDNIPTQNNNPISGNTVQKHNSPTPEIQNSGQTQIRQSTPTLYPRPIPPGTEDIGRIIAAVSTIKNLYPIPNAKVTIFTGPYASMDVIATNITDASGKTRPFELYAPPIANSLSPNSDASAYAEYNMLVQADGYIDNVHLKIPVFKGITSLQRSNLVSVDSSRPNRGPLFFDGATSYDL